MPWKKLEKMNLNLSSSLSRFGIAQSKSLDESHASHEFTDLMMNRMLLMNSIIYHFGCCNVEDIRFTKLFKMVLEKIVFLCKERVDRWTLNLRHEFFI